MGFSLNFNELKRFGNSINKVSNDFDRFLRNLLIEMAERVIAKTKLRTPVDTGALRRSWKLGKIRGHGTFIEVDILNGMEYATDVEYGHRLVSGGVEIRWVNGRFMLKISIDEVRKRLPVQYNLDLKEFCKERGLRYD